MIGKILAEQSIEELISLIDIEEEDAGDLIMRARAALV